MLEFAVPYLERAQDRMREQLGDMDWEALSVFSDRVIQADTRAELAPSRNGRPPASA
jgi:hypothetical protein